MKIIVNIILNIVFFLYQYGAIILYMFSTPRVLHYMQQNGYKNSDFMRWITKNPKLAFKSNSKQLIAIGIFYLIITCINSIFLTKMNAYSSLIVLLVETIAMFVIFVVANLSQILRDKKERKKSKKPLVYTARAKRLIFWNFITVALLEISFLGSLEQINVMVKILTYSFFIFVLPINMIIANFIGSPTEKFIGDRYIASAKRKLRKKAYKNLIKIGITGSYRKNKHKIYIRNYFK